MNFIEHNNISSSYSDFYSSPNLSNGQIIINRILKCISENDIQNYLLHETTTKSEELFFIKKECTLLRNKLTTKCEVTIYHDFEKDDKIYRGSSSFVADLNMSEYELNKKIVSAYHSAMSVKNPYYSLPSADRMESSMSITEKAYIEETADEKKSSEESASKHYMYTGKNIADIIYKNDIFDDAFINSLEIFVTNESVRIVNSNGIKLHYNDITFWGEYVVQAKEPTDVELYQDFKYSHLDNDISHSLSSLVKNSLKTIKDRSMAIPISNINNGNLHYENIILEGSSVYELFSYYLKRLDASMIYPGYSHYKIGDSIADTTMTEDDVKHNHLNITLTPKCPYSSEGIKLFKLKLIENNIVKYITGNARFSFYLGIPAVGTYESYHLECGNTSIIQMQDKPYLKIVNFSDFQMDELTGQFGGEFRLAYYYDGKNTIPVTNGSISGNINDIIKSLLLSKESQSSYHFDGPLAVSYTNV